MVFKAPPTMNAREAREILEEAKIGTKSIVRLRTQDNKPSSSYLGTVPNKMPVSSIRNIKSIEEAFIKWKFYSQSYANALDMGPQTVG